VYLNRLEKEQREAFIAMLAECILQKVRKMELQHKINATENCDGSFEVYYDIDDSFKIVEEFAKLTTKHNEVARIGRQELRQVKRTKPGMKFSVRALIMLLLTSWVTSTNAAFWELSSPPGELSLLDVGSAVAIGVGVTALATGAALPMAAVALPLAATKVAALTAAGATAAVFGTEAVVCGLTAHRVGSAIRIADHARGKYTLSDDDLKKEALGIVIPGAGVGLRAFEGLQENNPGLKAAINTASAAAKIPAMLTRKGPQLEPEAGISAVDAPYGRFGTTTTTTTNNFGRERGSPLEGPQNFYTYTQTMAAEKLGELKENPYIQRGIEIATSTKEGPSARNKPTLGVNLSSYGISGNTQRALESEIIRAPLTGQAALLVQEAAPSIKEYIEPSSFMRNLQAQASQVQALSKRLGINVGTAAPPMFALPKPRKG
jgi:hypothetical protein